MLKFTGGAPVCACLLSAQMVLSLHLCNVCACNGCAGASAYRQYALVSQHVHRACSHMLSRAVCYSSQICHAVSSVGSLCRWYSMQVIPALAHHSSPSSTDPRSSLRKALLGDSSQGSPQGSPLKYPLGSPQGSPLKYPLGSPQRSPLKHPKGSPLGSPPGSDGLSEALFGNLSQGSPQGSPLGSLQASSAYSGLSYASFGGCSQSSKSVSSVHCTPTSPGSARPSLRRKLSKSSTS